MASLGNAECRLSQDEVVVGQFRVDLPGPHLGHWGVPLAAPSKGFHSPHGFAFPKILAPVSGLECSNFNYWIEELVIYVVWIW